MKGQFSVRSNLFDANEWISATEAASTETPAPSPEAGDPALEAGEVFDRF